MVADHGGVGERKVPLARVVLRRPGDSPATETIDSAGVNHIRSEPICRDAL